MAQEYFNQGQIKVLMFNLSTIISYSSMLVLKVIYSKAKGAYLQSKKKMPPSDTS